MGKVYIGTSGWHYKHWRGLFYPPEVGPSEMFAFYARTFDTVEINNSFYHLPSLKTFDAWREAAPKGFCFAVKGSRFITHMKKLKDPESSTDKFFLGVERLQKKLGPILFQLPPRWDLNIDRLSEFLEVLPDQYRYVFEFRDERWLVPEVYEALRRHDAAFCIHDFADMKVPPEVTANFTYLRFHGPTSAKYAGSYSGQQLRQWAKWIQEHRSKLRSVYAYFNNDIGGEAVKNAVTLKRLVDE